MIIKQQVNNGDKTERCEKKKKQRRLSKKGPSSQPHQATPGHINNNNEVNKPQVNTKD